MSQRGGCGSVQREARGEEVAEGPTSCAELPAFRGDGEDSLRHESLVSVSSKRKVSHQCSPSESLGGPLGDPERRGPGSV